MRRPSLQLKKAMTLAEILIVVSLISIVSIAIYNALVNGLKVWDRSRTLLQEEDVAVFFEKISEDLRNSFTYSLIPVQGNEFRFTFPTRVRTTVDQRRRGQDEEYADEIGQVEYYYDLQTDTLFKRSAVYGQAVNYQFGEPKKILTSISDFRFQYIYLTEKEALNSSDVLDILPSSVEITVKFVERGKERILTKIVDLPLGGAT